MGGLDYPFVRFVIAQRTLPWQRTNFLAKFAHLTDATLIRRTGVPNLIAGSQFRF